MLKPKCQAKKPNLGQLHLYGAVMKAGNTQLQRKLWDGDKSSREALVMLDVLREMDLAFLV